MCGECLHKGRDEVILTAHDGTISCWCRRRCRCLWRRRCLWRPSCSPLPCRPGRPPSFPSRGAFSHHDRCRRGHSTQEAAGGAGWPEDQRRARQQQQQRRERRAPHGGEVRRRQARGVTSDPKRIPKRRPRSGPQISRVGALSPRTCTTSPTSRSTRRRAMCRPACLILLLSGCGAEPHGRRNVGKGRGGKPGERLDSWCATLP